MVDGAESWTEDGGKCSLSVVSCVLSVQDTINVTEIEAAIQSMILAYCCSGGTGLRTIQLPTGIDCTNPLPTNHLRIRSCHLASCECWDPSIG